MTCFDNTPKKPIQQSLTDAQVRAGARPGESWEQARNRLSAPHGRTAAPGSALEATAEMVDASATERLDDLEGVDTQGCAFTALSVPEHDAACALVDDWSGLTVAQVTALAAPGDDWEAGRNRAYRLHHCVTACTPCPICNYDGKQLYGGWLDRRGHECRTCETRASYSKIIHSF